MHVQIITFNLDGMTDAELLKVGEDVFLPELLKVPGLLSKIWMRDPANNTYGGVYTWEDVQAMLNYAQSDLFEGFASSPNFVNITSQDFDMIESPTRIMHGVPATVAIR